MISRKRFESLSKAERRVEISKDVEAALEKDRWIETDGSEGNHKGTFKPEVK